MILYLARRLLQSLPSLVGATMVAFALLYALGDPTDVLLNPASTPEQRVAFRHQLGLDQPLPVQYVSFLGRLVQGDLGESFLSHEPVTRMIGRSFPNTLQLAIAAQLLALALSIPLGSLAAHRRIKDRSSWLDRGVVFFVALGQSMPWFYIALLLIFGFGVALHVLPVSGMGSPQHLVLPVVTLSVGYTAIITQVTRTQMLLQLRLEYVRTARAKGLSDSAVVLAHALRNVLVPVVTMVGLSFGQMLGGIVIVELVFAWPGIGSLMLEGVTSRDYPVVLGVLLFAATLTIFVNFLVDMLYFVIDPRIQRA